MVISQTEAEQTQAPNRHLKTIFLLGAGASKPAGIPTIAKMTNEFTAHPLLEPKKHIF